MDLKCSVQRYAWGKVGEESEVARLARANTGLEVEEGGCYAELWAGTHPSGPSLLARTGEPLLEWIDKNPHVLGKASAEFGHRLPFLLKVLSINKPLSIQAHPNKEHAVRLHEKDPVNYKDSNHKPEMAIALTPFEALLGFVPDEEIRKNFENIPELAEVIGTEEVNALLCSTDTKTHLKICFHKLVSADPSLVEEALENLINRLKVSDEHTRTVEKASMIERLYSYFPGDVGVFGAYFFNYIQLNPGEAIYLAANEPHAYLSGDCVECMACSDNVVRAGLTPKMKDVETLCSMLTYDCSPPDTKLFKPTEEDDYSALFSPPVPDFAVLRITVPSGEKYEVRKKDSASIVIVTSGAAECPTPALKKGSVLFLPANETMSFTVTEDITLYQAFANI